MNPSLRELIFHAVGWTSRRLYSPVRDHSRRGGEWECFVGNASVATTGRYLHVRPRESSGMYLGAWRQVSEAVRGTPTTESSRDPEREAKACVVRVAEPDKRLWRARDLAIKDLLPDEDLHQRPRR